MHLLEGFNRWEGKVGHDFYVGLIVSPPFMCK